jgi:peptidoglycan/xylan/chitin deacetylase (PgdA/CDA1 family)
VLTFDDGYLDNWVYAYPILKKYGLNGTIFVNPDFVDPTVTTRPNLEDVSAGRIKRTELKWSGHLSWPEMRAMESSGVIDVQNHSQTHTWYFKSGRIVDFHHPGDGYHWLAWNKMPERKFGWVDESQEEFVEFGSPVYEFGRSLGIRVYYDSPGLHDHLVEFVQSRGERKFFDDCRWKDYLWQEVERYRQCHADTGRYETQVEYENRLYHEIVDSKQTIECNLQKKVQFLCWPGGAFTDQARALALQNGHLATTKGPTENQFGNDPTTIHRIATYLDYRRYNRFILHLASLPFFILQLKRYSGNSTAATLFKAAAGLQKTARSLAKARS